MASIHRRKRILAWVDKALTQPERYLATHFETTDQAHIAAALAQYDSASALAMLGWTP